MYYIYWLLQRRRTVMPSTGVEIINQSINQKYQQQWPPWIYTGLCRPQASNYITKYKRIIIIITFAPIWRLPANYVATKMLYSKHHYHSERYYFCTCYKPLHQVKLYTTFKSLQLMYYTYNLTNIQLYI